MEEIIRKLKAEVLENQKIIKSLKRYLLDCPKGRVQITMAGPYSKYYWITEGERKYLRKNELDFVKRLAEKAYYAKLLQETEEQLRILQSFLKHFDPRAQIRVYEEMHPARKALVEPLVLPDEEYARKWLEEAKRETEKYKNTYPKPAGLLTLNGENVRSKSEKILADALYHHELFYVYEAPVKLGNKIVFSDFKVLSKRRKNVYWEHCGMMDHPEYAEGAAKKIMLYEEEGIMLGDQLIVTMETSQNPLDVNDIERLIEKYLL